MKTETKSKLSEQKKGIKNPMFGKTKELHHLFGKKFKQKNPKKQKKIIDLSTNIIYNSINEASEKLNINSSTLYKYILGYNKKINNFKYYE